MSVVFLAIDGLIILVRFVQENLERRVRDTLHRMLTKFTKILEKFKVIKLRNNTYRRFDWQRVR